MLMISKGRVSTATIVCAHVGGLKMKKLIATAALFAVMSAGASVAATYTVDNFIDTADQCQGNETLGVDCDFVGTNPDNEVAALESIIGLAAGSLEFDTKYADASLSFSKDDAGNFFVDIAPAITGYFILKFGNGGTSEPSHYFFENIGELDKLVWTNAQVNGLMSACVEDDAGTQYVAGNCRLSHVTTVVPVPAAGLMLLTGIGGMALVRRRRKSA